MASERKVARDIQRMAAAAKAQQRRHTLQRWMSQGHVSIVNDDDPLNIRVQIEDEYFSGPRETFPTSELIAKLALALAAGQSDTKRNTLQDDMYAQMGAYAFTSSFRVSKTREELGYAYDQCWLDEAAPITATVKPRKQRGLRP